jgi:RNA-directed DNA polymerase
LIQKWLNAGVMENGEWAPSNVGSPQGATVSPLLANVYLHYALDLWVQRWRKQPGRGEIIFVRYADDCAPRRRGKEANRPTGGSLAA